MVTTKRISTEPSTSPNVDGWGVPPPFVFDPRMKAAVTCKQLFHNWGPTVVAEVIPHDQSIFYFRQMQYCAYRLHCLYQKAATDNSVLRSEYRMWYSRYGVIRNVLITSNMGLVHKMVDRFRFSCPRDDLVSEGAMALIRATDSFDPQRGFRFSTYACNAIARSCSRYLMMRNKNKATQYQDGWDGLYSGERDQREMGGDDELLYLSRLREIMRTRREMFSRDERSILDGYFAKNMTLDAIGASMSVSKETIRKTKNNALTKLRMAMNLDPVLQ